MTTPKQEPLPRLPRIRTRRPKDYLRQSEAAQAAAVVVDMNPFMPEAVMRHHVPLPERRGPEDAADMAEHRWGPGPAA